MARNVFTVTMALGGATLLCWAALDSWADLASVASRAPIAFAL